MSIGTTELKVIEGSFIIVSTWHLFWICSVSCLAYLTKQPDDVDNQNIKTQHLFYIFKLLSFRILAQR